MNRPLAAFVEELRLRGLNPVVSSLEAATGTMEETLSFIPIVYVDDTAPLAGLPAATPTSKSVAFVLPMTDNVRRHLSPDDPGMVVPSWGLLDALASPGRQADAARLYLSTIAGP